MIKQAIPALSSTCRGWARATALFALIARGVVDKRPVRMESSLFQKTLSEGRARAGIGEKAREPGFPSLLPEGTSGDDTVPAAPSPPAEAAHNGNGHPQEEAA